jgi:hypothetical protein
MDDIIDITVLCPHCEDPIIIEKLNCCIFRHGTMKQNGKQIDPHSSQELCIFLKEKDLIYGCGKPFRIILDSKGVYLAEICEYI